MTKMCLLSDIPYKQSRSNDPTETNDLRTKHPDIVARLYERILAYKANMIPAQNLEKIWEADPMFHNNTWSPGWCSV